MFFASYLDPDKCNFAPELAGQSVLISSKDTKLVLSRANFTNLLEGNSDFRFGTLGWVLVNCTLAMETGAGLHPIRSQSGKITATANNAFCSSDVSWVPDPERYASKHVTGAAWVMLPSTNSGSGFLRLWDSASTVQDSQSLPRDDQWHFVTVTKTIVASPDRLRVSGYLTASGDVMYIAGCCVYEGLSAPDFMPAPAPYMSEQRLIANAFALPAPASDWYPSAYGALLAASKSAKKCWIPLNWLKIGDVIVSYNLLGEGGPGSGGYTLDAKLLRMNKGHSWTQSDLAGGAISQQTADGAIDAEAVLTAPEVVAEDKSYILEVLGTTGTGAWIQVTTAEVKVYRIG